MTTNPSVSVVIPCFNSAKTVVQAIESVLSQTYPPNEIVVVDDGSTDDTELRLEKYSDRIRYVHQSNAGVSKARNLGIEESKGDLIAFLDHDDFWLPEKLEKQISCLLRDPRVAVVHTDVAYVDDNAKPLLRPNVNRRSYSGHCYGSLFRANRVCMSTVMVARWAIDKVGRFDEQIVGASTDDWDLWMRIAIRFPFAYIDEQLACYRIHAGNASNNQQMMVEGELYVIEKQLNANPDLWSQYGATEIRRRLYQLAFGAGYQQLDVGDTNRARLCFLKAVRNYPAGLKAWAYLVLALIPAKVLSVLRR